MANLYDIQNEIRELLEFNTAEYIDIVSGEIIEIAGRLDELKLEQDSKIENIALYIKNLSTDVDAIKVEEEILKGRRFLKEKKLNFLRDYLSNFMQGSGLAKFESARCVLSFRKSKSLEITNHTDLMMHLLLDGKNSGFLMYKEPEIVKSEVKKALESGEEMPGVVIAEKRNLQVK